MAFEEILIISVILAFITALLYRLLINQGEMRKLKGEMKFYQDKIKGAQKDGDREAVSKLSSDMLKLSSRQFRMTMKPLMVTGLVFLLIIGWIAAQYGEAVIAAPFANHSLGSKHNVQKAARCGLKAKENEINGNSKRCKTRKICLHRQ